MSRGSLSREVWGSPGFVPYLLGRCFATAVRTGLHATVLWQINEMFDGDSSKMIAVYGGVSFVPVLVFGLFAGAVADRHDRLRIAQWSVLILFFCTIGLTAWTWTGEMDLKRLMVLVFVSSAAASFEGPARVALLPRIVSRAAFPRAVLIAGSFTTMAFMLGPVLAGVMIKYTSVAGAHALASVLAIGTIVSTATIPKEFGAGDATASIGLRAIRDGLTFVFKNQVVLGCMTLDMLAVIFGSAVGLLPHYATEILGVDAGGYGILHAASEAGAIIMALIMLRVPEFRRAGRALLIGVGVYGLATVGFGLSRSFPISVLALVIVGMADYISVVMRNTLVQLATPDEIRGRVSSVHLLFIQASNRLGVVESGYVAQLTNPVFSVVSGGIGAVLVVIAVAVLMPKLRRYESASETIRDPEE